MKQHARPATAAEITEIVGPLDDAVLVRIVETEATPAEVLEAFTWATADDQIGTELEHRPLRLVLLMLWIVDIQSGLVVTSVPKVPI